MKKILLPLVALGMLATSVARADQPTRPLPPTAPPNTTAPIIPDGSGDYSKMLALGFRYKQGKITFAQLTKSVLAAKLPPHSLGDLYLMMVPPPPPPGMKVDPLSMPSDWEKTFGEIAMIHFAGQITKDEYEKLHKAAHGKKKGFPNCGKK